MQIFSAYQQVEFWMLNTYKCIFENGVKFRKILILKMLQNKISYTDEG